MASNSGFGFDACSLVRCRHHPHYRMLRSANPLGISEIGAKGADTLSMKTRFAGNGFT